MKQSLKLYFPLVITLLGSNCLAQGNSDSPYDGNWTAEITLDGGVKQTAQVKIDDYAGTWIDKTDGGQNSNPCTGREFPLTVHDSTLKRLEFTVWRAPAVPGCTNLPVNLSVAGDQLEGSIGTTGKVRLRKSTAASAADR